LWEYAPENTLFLSSPLVVGARVYGASCVLDPPTSYGSVFCLDAETGRPLWVSEFRDGAAQKEFKGFFSSPALSADGKSLVIGQGLHSDADCELVCLDADTGRVRWLLKTPLHIEGSPAIEGDLVIAGAGAIEAGDDHRAVGNPGFVLAVRISDGKELWRFTVADPESSPVVEDGVAYIGSGLNGNAIVALRTLGDEELRAKGLSRVLWQTPTGYPATGAVTLAGDRVLVGCGKGDFVYAARDPEGCVIALDRTSGRELWRAALPDTVLGSIAVREGKALCPVRNGEVVALDLESGRILWRHGISRGMPVLSGPAFAEGYVYAVSQDGTLAVLDGATGSRIEKVYLNSTAKPPSMGLSVSSPMVAEGRLYVGSETGGLRCFAGSRGR
jgi:outer membrane protein assembly factor BamB